MSNYKEFYSSTGICTDTRAITDGCLFICIQGANFDGNTFAAEALKQGASHVIVDNPEFLVDSPKYTFVENSVEYLQELANYHRKQFDIPVIGITGSNGKTTSKELIHAVLSKKYNVLSTIGNLNNHLGVPFTLLRLTKEHEIAIIEMGANHPNDIGELCEIAEPNHGVITNIGKAHLEGFLSYDGVVKAKKQLYDYIQDHNGKIIYNLDDPKLSEIVPTSILKFTYGTKDSDITGELVRLTPYVEMKWTSKEYSSPLLSGQMVGQYNFYNYLAAAAFGTYFKVSPNKISEALEEYTPTNKRSQVVKTKSNTLILDCYNANPTSMKSALESFAKIDSDLRKVIILGEMRELGDESAQEHKQIVDLCEELNLSGHFVGTEFQSFKSSSIISWHKTTDELSVELRKTPLEHTLVLLKGSRGIALEKLENQL